MISEYRVTVSQLSDSEPGASPIATGLVRNYTVGAAVTSPSRLRLQKSRIAIILPEIALVLIFVCYVVALAMHRPDKILPRDPGSLATRWVSRPELGSWRPCQKTYGGGTRNKLKKRRYCTGIYCLLAVIMRDSVERLRLASHSILSTPHVYVVNEDPAWGCLLCLSQADLSRYT